MPDQPKKKPANAVTRNTERKSGKASKSGPDVARKWGKSYRGSHTTKAHLTELQKALLGGGAMARITRPAPEKPAPEANSA